MRLRRVIDDTGGVGTRRVIRSAATVSLSGDAAAPFLYAPYFDFSIFIAFLILIDERAYTAYFAFR